MKRAAALVLVLLALPALADEVPAEQLPMKTQAPPAAGAATAPAGTQAPEALPDGRSLLRAHVAASGGDALEKVRNAVVRGTLAIPAQGLQGTVRVAYLRPDKIRSTVELAGLGAIEQGYDGSTGWEISMLSGPRILSEAEVRQLKQADGNPFNVAGLDSLYDTAETVRLGDFQGAPAYEVRLVADGRESTAWFDPDSKLMVGLRTTVTSALGEIPAVISLGSYKSFGGLKLPTKSVQSVMGKTIEVTSTIDAVELDVPAAQLPPFEPPPEVRSLAKPEGEAGAKPEAEAAKPEVDAKP